MGPELHSISDQGSESPSPRRGRPAVPPAQILAAAERLFAEAASPASVTMEAVATAAEVGKGTLFRAFGSRDALLDALWSQKLAVLRDGLDEDAPAGPRAVAFLAALLNFKLANRHLIRAREIAPRLLQTEHYRWMHGVLRRCLSQAAPAATDAACIYAAHSLLATLHIDLIEEMMAQGLTLADLRAAQAAQLAAVVAGLSARPDVVFGG